MELQELVERIERWKARGQGSASAAVPPSLPTAMAIETFEEESVEGEMAMENGSMEEIEAVEEIPEIDSFEAVPPVEGTSEVAIDQIEDVEDVEEVEDP
jgi:hypothetical protein